jgi:hypothetical protein
LSLYPEGPQRLRGREPREATADNRNSSTR